MTKSILLTGATDGIGLETAKRLAAQGHRVLLHGRNAAKLDTAHKLISEISGDLKVETYLADLSILHEVENLADAVGGRYPTLDILINNAGVFSPAAITGDGLDIRFAVNTVAPYLLTARLAKHMSPAGRVINLSSAAQAPVDLGALNGVVQLSDYAAYAQSKLALTMWTKHLAQAAGPDSPIYIAVNPGSLLGSKMVKEAFGTEGKDISIGADILVRAALDNAFQGASGAYFDNDIGDFGRPHPNALDPVRCAEVARAIEKILISVR